MAWADAVLVGARTVRLHGTSCLLHAPDLLRQRLQRGLAPQPPVVVWSRSGALAGDLPFFQQPFERWLLTSAPVLPSAPKGTGFRGILPFDNWPLALARLSSLGWRRIAVLGGAQLVGSLLGAEEIGRAHV